MGILKFLSAAYDNAVQKFGDSVDNYENATAQNISVPGAYPHYLVTMGDGTQYSGNHGLWFPYPSQPGNTCVSDSQAIDLRLITARELKKAEPVTVRDREVSPS